MKKLFWMLSVFISATSFSQVKVGSYGALEPIGNYPALKLGSYETPSYPVKTIAQRNAIGFKRDGITSYVKDSSKTYRWDSLATSWVELSILSGSDTAKIRSDIDNLLIRRTTLGTLVSDNFNRASLGSLWGLSGASTFTTNGTNLVVSGGTNVLTDYIFRNDYFSALDDYVIEAKIVNNTINTKGIAIGKGWLIAYLDMSTSSASVLRINLNTSEKTVTYRSTGTSMNVSVGDTLNYKLAVEKGRITFNVNNQTKKTTLVGEFFLNPFNVSLLLPLAGSNYLIGSLQGTHSVLYFSATGRNSISPDILVLGDSRSQGYNSLDINKRWPTLLARWTNKVVDFWGAQGARIVSITSGINEITKINPKSVIIWVGINSASSSAATMLADYATMINAVKAVTNNITIMLEPVSLIGAQVRIDSFNNGILSAYAGQYPIVDLASTMVASDISDNAHPTTAGHVKVADLVFSTISAQLTGRQVQDNLDDLGAGNLRSTNLFLTGHLYTSGGIFTGGTTVGKSGEAYRFSSTSSAFMRLDAQSGNSFFFLDKTGGSNYSGVEFDVNGTRSYVLQHENDGNFKMERGTGNNDITVNSSGTVGIGVVNNTATAQLQIESTTKGILIPRLTQTAINSMASPATSILVFNSTTNKFNFWNGAFWATIADFVVTVGAAPTAGTITLVSGTATVSTTAVAIGSIIEFSLQNCSNCGFISKGIITAGSSFIINSSNASDGSLVSWRIIY